MNSMFSSIRGKTMKLEKLFIVLLVTAVFSTSSVADEVKMPSFGTTEVTFDLEKNKSGATIFTLIAQIPETNNLLRGLKNTDQRRLSKLGQLVYQCKLLVRQLSSDEYSIDDSAPALTARNFSLFTGVDLPLSVDQRIGVQVNALQTINESSLFDVRFGDGDTLKTRWQILGEGTALNLKQFDLGLFSESELFETSQSVEITARFPIFQMTQPVTEWRYHFNLRDFNRAVRYIDENCTPSGFRTLLQGRT